MQYRAVEITVISAKGLKRVKHLSKMDVYVVVSLSGGPEMEQKTPVDKGSGPNPNWNFPMNFNVDEDKAKAGRLSLAFKVMCHRRIHSDKDIGQADVPLKELLENGGDGKFIKYVTYQLKKPNGKHRGELNLSYKFAPQPLGASSSVKLADPTGQFPGIQARQNPIGYVPVYGSGQSGQSQQLFGAGHSQCMANNAEVEAAFLSGVLRGMLIGEMLGNGADGRAGAQYDYDAAAAQEGSAAPARDVGGGGAC